jgi:hypothetical protein
VGPDLLQQFFRIGKLGQPGRIGKIGDLDPFESRLDKLPDHPQFGIGGNQSFLPLKPFPDRGVMNRYPLWQTKCFHNDVQPFLVQLSEPDDAVVIIQLRKSIFLFPTTGKAYFLCAEKATSIIDIRWDFSNLSSKWYCPKE